MTDSEIRISLQEDFQSYINTANVIPATLLLESINIALDALYDGPGTIPVGPPPIL